MNDRTESELDIRRKKLTFRAWHRGMKEMDFILGNFADAHLANYDESQLDRFEYLLRIPDQPFYAMLVQGAEVPTDLRDEMFGAIFEFAKNPMKKS